MICWICGTKDKDTPSASLLKKLGIKDVTAVLRCGRLRWYEHVQCAMSCMKSVTDLPLPLPRGKGRPRKTWSERVKTDISECGLAGIDSQDRDAWRAGVQRSLVLPTPLDGTQTIPWSKNGYNDDDDGGDKGGKNGPFGSDLSKITRLVVAIKSLRFALKENVLSTIQC